MRILKRILIGAVIFVVVVVALFLVCIGPWPVYKDSNYAESDYYKEALAAIDADAAKSDFTTTPGKLSAGWGVRIMTPSVGVPMGGYGGRPDGKRSTGVRDELKVKAVSFSDGKDTLVLVGADMLLVPPNIADMTIQKVAAKTPLGSHNLFFSASHTHCGPGGFAPGLAAKISAGEYDPSVPEFLSSTFADAIVEAYQSMKPAKLAHGSVDAEAYIRNRTRDAGGVDHNLCYMVVEQEGGRRCYITRFSAHPTFYGQRMMEFTAEYPGEFMRHIEEQTNATAVYMGGGLGSMSSRGVGGETESERIVLFGQALGKLVLENAATLDFADAVDVASLAVPVGVPPVQARPLSPKWRLSPLASGLLGVPKQGFVQGGRIGSLVFVGLPFDVSGELTRDWRAAKANAGWDLWVTSFSRAYLGYLSPDKYYYEVDEKGHLDYEVGLMSWLGPNSSAYFSALLDRVVEQLGKSPVTVAAAS